MKKSKERYVLVSVELLEYLRQLIESNDFVKVREKLKVLATKSTLSAFGAEVTEIERSEYREARNKNLVDDHVELEHNPSCRPQYVEWKDKDIKKEVFTAQDFLGIYLAYFKKVYKKEDTAFCCSVSAKIFTDFPARFNNFVSKAIGRKMSLVDQKMIKEYIIYVIRSFKKKGKVLVYSNVFPFGGNYYSWLQFKNQKESVENADVEGTNEDYWKDGKDW